MTIEERLQELLDQKDVEIEKLAATVHEQHEILHGAHWAWVLPMKIEVDARPVPRIDLIYEDLNGHEFSTKVVLVLPSWGGELRGVVVSASRIGGGGMWRAGIEGPELYHSGVYVDGLRVAQQLGLRFYQVAPDYIHEVSVARTQA